MRGKRKQTHWEDGHYLSITWDTTDIITLFTFTFLCSRFHITHTSFRDNTSRFRMSFVRSLHQGSYYVSWDSLAIVHRNDLYCKRVWKGMVMVVQVFKQWEWNAYEVMTRGYNMCHEEEEVYIEIHVWMRRRRNELRSGYVSGLHRRGKCADRCHGDGREIVKVRWVRGKGVHRFWLVFVLLFVEIEVIRMV